MPARPRILVIDDDPLFRSLLSAALREGYDVGTASEGSEGYYRTLDAPADLIVVDIQMPGWDGLKTVSMLKANPRTKPLPAIVLTADGTRTTIVEAIRLGAVDYVLKPGFSKDDFLTKVAKHLPEERATARLASLPVAATAATEHDEDNWE